MQISKRHLLLAVSALGLGFTGLARAHGNEDHPKKAGPVRKEQKDWGIAGSAKIGRGCTVGGGAIVLGHLELADGVHISAASVVMRSITRPGQYSGVFPLDDNASWEKNAATLRQLHTLRDRLRSLEKKIDTP